MVISKELDTADRVTVVTYGGSGHEPAQAGYVGKGALDIQVVGDIFAAPNGQQGARGFALDPELCGRPVSRQTGHEARSEGRSSLTKRFNMTLGGLSGAVAMYHIAGAAAREGKSLDEVAAICQKYAENMASVTVKVSDATHPQTATSFGDLGETDLMER